MILSAFAWLAQADGNEAANPPTAPTAEKASRFYAEGQYTEAARLFRQLAEQGDAKAQTRLGTMLLHGQGEEKDMDQGVAWYVKAASQGEAEAQDKLGQLYGMTKDYRQALLWFRKAAAAGHERAKKHLIRLGVSRNP